MHFLIFGKTGQVAQELARLPISATFLARDDVDLNDPDKIFSAIVDAKPDAVINAAAWTDVDGAEDAYDDALAVNGAAPAAMARACVECGITLVQISTDYVFDGNGDVPFSPGDKASPLGAYGRTKLVGEHGIANAGGTHAILRTSWVFSAHGKNFVKTMLRLSETMTALNIVGDQIGGPTSAKSIAKACVKIADALASDPGKAGTYHFSATPDVSWADFARRIFEIAGRDVVVSDIPTSQYPTPAQRPLNSRLDCTTTEQEFGITRPDWQADLKDVINEVLGQE